MHGFDIIVWAFYAAILKPSRKYFLELLKLSSLFFTASEYVLLINAVDTVILILVSVLFQSIEVYSVSAPISPIEFAAKSDQQHTQTIQR